MTKTWNANALIAWIAGVVFLGAAIWPNWSESAFPLAGLRNLTTPLVGWPLALVALAIAVFLSMPRFLTRDRLLICAGFCFCLFLAAALYAAPTAALSFGFISGNLMRQCARPVSKEDTSINTFAS